MAVRKSPRRRRLWLSAFAFLQCVVCKADPGGTGTSTQRTLSSTISNRYEQQRYDGWYNNLAHPDWGAVESHLTRKTPPAYADGVYMMSGENRPSPRQLSQAFMKGEDGLGSLMNRTALQTFFGQVGAAGLTLVILIPDFLLEQVATSVERFFAFIPPVPVPTVRTTGMFTHAKSALIRKFANVQRFSIQDSNRTGTVELALSKALQ